MRVYFLVFFVTIMLSIILPAKTDVQWHRKLFFTFLPLFLFGALRVNFGNDYLDYKLFFDTFHNQNGFHYDPTSRSEVGFQFLCYIMPSYRSVLILNAFLLCLALAIFIDKNIPRNYLWLTILLVFLNPEKNIYGNLVGIRNGLVVSGFILGCTLIQHRRFFLFALLTVLLSTFHTAALLFMPLAYFVGRNTTIKRKEIVIWMGFFALLLSFSMSGLIDIVSPIISNYFERYETYLEMGAGRHRGLLLTAASLALATLIFLLYRKQEDPFTKEQNTLIRLGLLYVASAFLGSLAVRANYFYDMFFIGTVVVLYSNNKRKQIGMALAILAVMMSLYSLRLWQTNEYVAGNPRYAVYTSLIGSW